MIFPENRYRFFRIMLLSAAADLRSYLSIQASRKPSFTPIAVVTRFLTLQRVMVGNCSSSIHATGTSSVSIFCALA